LPWKPLAILQKLARSFVGIELVNTLDYL
jgi:hypothetical protein